MTEPFIPLRALLDGRAFLKHAQYAYPISGSFTGFLIDEIGWERYRGFYSDARARTFEAALQRHCGMSLPEAERRWRSGILQRRGEFDPQFRSALCRARIESYYYSWRLLPCIEAVDALRQRGAADWRLLWMAFSAHLLPGDYASAEARMLETLGKRDPDEHVPHVSSAHVGQGHARDLAGRRDDAIAAYRQALAAPDDWHRDGGAHAEAARRLKKPFTERDRERWLQHRRGR
ncbi:MAG: hypothetical protein HY321_16805 [Armatimonadetes bacterium]|nr:hypothetical protein [Armatimonadota bacterium]